MSTIKTFLANTASKAKYAIPILAITAFTSMKLFTGCSNAEKAPAQTNKVAAVDTLEVFNKSIDLATRSLASHDSQQVCLKRAMNILQTHVKKHGKKPLSKQESDLFHAQLELAGVYLSNSLLSADLCKSLSSSVGVYRENVIPNKESGDNMTLFVDEKTGQVQKSK